MGGGRSGPFRVRLEPQAHGHTRILVGGPLPDEFAFHWSGAVQPRYQLSLRGNRSLARPVDVPQRLAENVRDDWDPEVRLENLLSLVEEYPDHPTTLEILRAACADTQDEIRLQAGIALGKEGIEVLLGVASLTRASLEPWQRWAYNCPVSRRAPFSTRRCAHSVWRRPGRVSRFLAAWEAPRSSSPWRG